MMHGTFRSSRARIATLVVSIAGTVHFVLGVGLWGCLVVLVVKPWNLGPDLCPVLGNVPGDAWPCLVLAAWFGVTAAPAWKQRRIALAGVIVGWVLATGAFLYDIHEHNWRFNAMTPNGCRQTYLTWWWYRGPTRLEDVVGSVMEWGRG